MAILREYYQHQIGGSAYVVVVRYYACIILVIALPKRNFLGLLNIWHIMIMEVTSISIAILVKYLMQYANSALWLARNFWPMRRQRGVRYCADWWAACRCRFGAHNPWPGRPNLKSRSRAISASTLPIVAVKLSRLGATWRKNRQWYWREAIRRIVNFGSSILIYAHDVSVTCAWL